MTSTSLPIKVGGTYRVQVGLQATTMKCSLSGEQNAVFRTGDDRMISIDISNHTIITSNFAQPGAYCTVAQATQNEKG